MPFISRGAHDELRTAHETQILRLQRELEKEQERSAHLMDTVLSLKVSGATSIIRAAALGTKTAPKQRSAIEQAIDEHPRAIASVQHRNHLSRWAAKRMREKPDDLDEATWMDAVCDEIRESHTVNVDRDGDDEDDV
jgi:hypothetical protein